MGDVRKAWIEGPAGRLEAALREADDPRGSAVLAHPHPQQGGSMRSLVTSELFTQLPRLGLAVLRFNFRGVGGSDGTHDEGRGESGDLAAAAAWVRALAPGKPLILVGYSFGARCAVTCGIADKTIAGVVAIGLPVRIWPFDDLVALGRPLAVVQGTEDEFGSIEEVEAVIAMATPKGTLYPVAGASHLFTGRVQEAAAAAADAVEAILQGVGGSRP